MTTTDEQNTQPYKRIKSEKAAQFLKQMREVLEQFSPHATAAAEEEGEDEVFAGILASHLIAYSLRPRAIRSEVDVGALLGEYPGGRFRSDLILAEIAKMIAASGAMYRGHFELVNRDHSEYFFMFNRLGSRVDFRTRLSHELAKRLEPLEVATVLAPASAGGLLAQDIAAELGCSFAFFDIDHQSRPCPTLKSGYGVRGRTVIVNDMTTTGIGLTTMVEATKRLREAELVGIGLVAARGAAGRAKLDSLQQGGVQIEVLANLNMTQQHRDSCKLCESGVPITYSGDINR